MSFKVLIPDQVHASALDVLKKNNGNGEFDVIAPGKMNKDEVLAAVPGVDAMIVRSAVPIDAAVLAAADQLKIIVRAGTGVDNIDLVEATRRSVVVMNTPS